MDESIRDSLAKDLLIPLKIWNDSTRRIEHVYYSSIHVHVVVLQEEEESDCTPILRLLDGSETQDRIYMINSLDILYQ